VRAPRTILRDDQAGYPVQAVQRLADPNLGELALWGNPAIWTEAPRPLLAFFSSAKAPASAMLSAHDLAQRLRSGRATIIGGFHSPVEDEMLTVLLRGPAPVILCPARSLAGMRLKPAWREPLAAGRLLLLSAFPDNVRRATAATALARNRFVAAVADQVCIVHAEPGSRTEQLAREAQGWGKNVVSMEGV
jgi:predicted Rossmann fold nucleotide-binding protein DprA/Smf involved in DNA uptake